MIVLDANILIALLDANDIHHPQVVELLDHHADESYAASALTIAEALVYPAKGAREQHAARALDDVGLVVLPLGADDAQPLARIRAEYRVRMPDAVVLHTAIRNRGGLATFDRTLRKVAREARVRLA